MKTSNRLSVQCLIGPAGCLVAGSGSAQEVAEIPFFHAPPGTAALGGGIRFGQSPYLATDNEDQRLLDLIPLYLYQGKWLFARGTSGGIHLLRNDAIEFNLYTRYRFQKLDPDSNVFYRGLEEREQSLDAGIEVGLSQNWGELKFDWVTDTLNRHNGEEIRFSYRYRFESGPWSFSPYISWSWQDKKLTDYYFGVSEAEARPDLPAYSAGESQWLGLGINTSWQLTDRIVFFGNVGFTGTESDVVSSPLVEEASASQVFVGGTYIFGNVLKPDFIIYEERQGEWSWRVNYGYQAEGNIVSEIDQGDFSKSKLADVNIAGITLGKLLTDGPRVDFVGKLAAFRHLEEDEGNGNFWSYAAYIMAIGKGYSPWSKEEIFRWGFGFGGAYGRGIVVEGDDIIGTTSFGQFTSGIQGGARYFSMIVFFKDKDALEYFKKCELQFMGQSGIAVATVGAAGTPAYNDGVAIVTVTRLGLMGEFTISGARFGYKPLHDE